MVAPRLSPRAGLGEAESATPAPAGADIIVDEFLLHEAADTFAMLASATRLHLLYRLSLGEQDVGTLAAAVGGSVATVSQHLAKLRLANLVSSRRDGKRQIYVLDDPHIVTLVQQALDHNDELRSAGRPRPPTRQ